MMMRNWQPPVLGRILVLHLGLAEKNAMTDVQCLLGMGGGNDSIYFLPLFFLVQSQKAGLLYICKEKWKIGSPGEEMVDRMREDVVIMAKTVALTKHCI